MNKVVVFGIDGGSLKLIEEWKDKLPNFRQIMEEGSYGELESTIPPLTCPAWPCMFTGKNPGKLGMYGFTTIRPGQQYELGMHSSVDYHSTSLWKILNDYGRDVGLLNVPMTFPPHKVSSFMVCGIGSPETWKSNYTYPPSLKNMLDKLVGGYEIFPPIGAPAVGREERYLSILSETLDKRVKAAIYLMNHFSWDLFVCVFYVLDQVQHHFWHCMDENHPRHHTTKYQNVIRDFYQKVDTAIGALLKEIPSGANILVVSDHGFGGMHGNFAVNKWLEDNQFLKFRGKFHKDKINAVLYGTRELVLTYINIGLLRFILRLLPKALVEKLAILNEQKNRLTELYKNIDWSQTKAYGQGSAGMISVNLMGREPEGIVEPGEEYEETRNDIISRLKKLVNPQTGEALPIKVFKREEVYHGQYTSQAPDILFLIDKYPQTIAVEGQSQWVDLSRSEYLGWMGWHVQQGVFMAYGPDIKRERLSDLKIYDIAPTILHMLGVPVPGDVDGRVLTEIFKPESKAGERPVVYQRVDERRRVMVKIKQLKDSGRI